MTSPRRGQTCVVDSSAVLALLRDERGAELVGPRLRTAFISAVNWSEVVQKALDGGIGTAEMRNYLRLWGLQIVPAGQAEADLAAELRTPTRDFGLSIGDRFCLATAILRGLPALTADRSWDRARLAVEVQLIR